MMRDRSALCVLAFLLAGITSGGAADVTFSVLPIVRQDFGSMAYDFTADAGSGNAVLSRLWFPDLPVVAGAQLGVSSAADGALLWQVRASAWHSIISWPGVMVDEDWLRVGDFPPAPFSRTESSDVSTTWGVGGDATVYPFRGGPFSAGLRLEYRYQLVDHRASNIVGWQYDPNGGSYDLVLVSEAAADVLAYSVSTHMPGLGLAVSVASPWGISLEAALCYVPVFAADRDDHRLRSRLSTASGWGSGYHLTASLLFTPSNGTTAAPTFGIDGDVTGYSVRTTQTQSWYGDLDPGVPEGTVATGVGHVMTSFRGSVSIWAGFTLR